MIVLHIGQESSNSKSGSTISTVSCDPVVNCFFGPPVVWSWILAVLEVEMPVLLVLWSFAVSLEDFGILLGLSFCIFKLRSEFFVLLLFPVFKISDCGEVDEDESVSEIFCVNLVLMTNLVVLMKNNLVEIRKIDLN